MWNRDAGIVWGIAAGGEHESYARTHGQFDIGEASYSAAKTADDLALTGPRATDDELRGTYHDMDVLAAGAVAGAGAARPVAASSVHQPRRAMRRRRAMRGRRSAG